MNDRLPYAERYYENQPPPGVRQFRASLWCNQPGHPRTVAVAPNGPALNDLIRVFRCPVCGAGDTR